AQDRGLADRPGARGWGEGRLRDRGGHAGAAGGESRIGHRSVPTRAARQGAEARRVVEWSHALPPFESRGLTRAEHRRPIDLRRAHARAGLRVSIREPPGWTVERPDG